MTAFPALHYVAPMFDRLAKRRSDPAWLSEQRDRPDARLVLTWNSRNLLVLEPEPLAVMPAPDQVAALAPELHFLGLCENNAPWFAADLSHLDEAAAHSVALTLAPGAGFVDLRRAGALLPQRDGAVLAYARGLAWWHQRHRFCGVCGAPTRSEQAGHQRRCTNSDCNAAHFPRTDPAVIMLVEYEGRCLLGRQAVWQPGMVSTLAGFVEPGETLEQAVAREVLEETGVPVTDIRYVASQPWPFPSSLMLGYMARATDPTLAIDREELEDAAWYSADDIRDFSSRGLSLPRADSISRRLIETWLAGQA